MSSMKQEHETCSSSSASTTAMLPRGTRGASGRDCARQEGERIMETMLVGASVRRQGQKVLSSTTHSQRSSEATRRLRDKRGAGGGPRGKAKKRSEDDTGPITIEGAMPQKRFYRARAHVNPLSHNDCYEYPKTPKEMDWSVHYPNRPGLKVSIVDVGCGFGGLTVALSPLFPDKGVLGMEIRVKVCEFVRLRVEALRRENPGQYQNVSSLRTNSMLLLPHFLERHQLEKMFFCFPDPHFKAKNHRRRIISVPLLTEYAFYLRPGGLLYMITDVEELHQWHVEKAEAHPCFEAVPREEAEKDPAVKAMTEVTEEGKKVARMGGDKYWAVFRRIPDKDVPYTIF